MVMAVVYLIVFLVNICNTFEVQDTTHWVITESGYIESKLNSPLILNEPHDLLTFMTQDGRWDTIHRLYGDLKQRQTFLETLWRDLVKELNIEIYLDRKSFCKKAGNLKAIDWRILYDGSGKDIPESEYKFEIEMQLTRHLDNASDAGPDCTKMSKLSYTEDVFDNLLRPKEREKMILNSAASLPPVIKSHFNLIEFGEWTNAVLQVNPESWLHYNLASVYWQIKGDAFKALECSRRSVLYAPKKYKDLALLNMGTIFLQSMRADAALEVFHAAVNLDSSQVTNNFMLANAFAVVGDFENAIEHYNKALELKPSFDLASQYKNAVLCHTEVVKLQKNIRNLVYRLRRDLNKYKMLKDHWLKTQTLFVKDTGTENISVTEKIKEITGYDVETIVQKSEVLDFKLKMLSPPSFNDNWIKTRGIYTIEGLTELNDLIKQIKNKIKLGLFEIDTAKTLVKGKLHEASSEAVSKNSISQKGGGETTVTNKTDKLIKSEKKSSQHGGSTYLEVGKPLYPPTMNVRRNVHDFDRDPEWPSLSLCRSPNPISNAESIHPVFMPFENKGLSVKDLLTDKIGVPMNVEHELPWHPPACPQDKGASGFPQKKSLKQFTLEVISTGYLSWKLREYVNEDKELVINMQEAEIGQRIYAAMQMNLAPKWLLYTLASLYWRVRNNYQNALHCLTSANKVVVKKYKDVVLASLASVYLETGHFEMALQYAEEAYKISMYEPVTNFILSELSMVKKNRGSQMFHLKQVLRVEPNFMDGLARNLLVSWACTLKHASELEELADFSQSETFSDDRTGFHVVCEKDGSNCHLTHTIFKSGYSKSETSTIVRLLEHSSLIGNQDIHFSIFSEIIANMPDDGSDRVRHYENYQSLMKIVNKALHGCGPRECTSITPEDLSITFEDCKKQNMNIEYWVQIMGFNDLLLESDQSLAMELSKMSSDRKNMPSCNIYGETEEDFFLERVTRADEDGWQPIYSLMHQLTETLNYVDFISLGARIARYVDANPRCWAGLSVAGWWCGAGGVGQCAARCLAAAHRAAPLTRTAYPVRALAALLILQSKYEDAKHMAYLSFYMSPGSKTDALLVAVAHTFLKEYDQAVWMYRYALSLDENDVAAKSCLHATVCRMLFNKDGRLNH